MRGSGRLNSPSELLVSPEGTKQELRLLERRDSAEESGFHPVSQGVEGDTPIRGKPPRMFSRD